MHQKKLIKNYKVQFGNILQILLNKTEISRGKIDFYLDNIDILAKDNNFDFANLAISYGLVDSLKTRSEIEQYLS